MTPSQLVVLALVALGIWLIVRRANELFCIRVEGRALRISRGRVPQRLLDDIEDVVKPHPVAGGTIRVVIVDRAPRVEASGPFTPEQIQRLRNVVSLWPLARIRNAPRPKRR